MRVAGLLLAAGAGRRFGGPKALVSHDGVLWVDRAAAVLRDAGCAPVVVVLGASAASVRARAALDGCVVVDNPEWATGMGSSLRAGLAALTGAGVGTGVVSGVDADAGRVVGPDVGAADGPGVGADIGAVVVLPVDTPGVTAAAVERLRALASPTALARASYDGAPGHPVLIGSEHWAGVAASAVGDAGARDYLRTHSALDVPCGDVADGDDVDHPRDLPR
ncbi:molybdopterin-guanine dinucleotide biosynthesis protein A [Saccharothrix sp. NRRL B-16348]|uniref:nucleotidyltransferase family protein n=1 Tax=Saccharothrix sp. NRRL B-16348 TaxID=1415542 RepID=UPI0006AF07F2|nr:NTP transferase domain-containing protein [Saccharothrix sp. NRRL B-16348]KOX21609.1 molybdopterin-guanine dinucleotide biosynthesis protein A [Saccharothrix sp. NRRL B-16348]